MNCPIVILTDFGSVDPFVGIMKGVIKGISPNTPIIDLTHEIQPGNIQHGAITLWQSIPYLPKGAVILAVIDPGVGTQRRPTVINSTKHKLIGPDNGIFSYVLRDNIQAWEISNPDMILPNPRHTFHGRDIFAPAAANAARGVPSHIFGPAIQNLHRLTPPILDYSSPSFMHGEIIYIDRFGNALTSLGVFDPRKDLRFDFNAWVDEIMSNKDGSKHKIRAKIIDLRRTHLKLSDNLQLPMVYTFSDIPDGKCAFLVGSCGLLEIAANLQSASALLNINVGDHVTLVL